MSISNYLDSVARPFEVFAPWILRLVLGVSFILHGLGKFPLPPEKMVTWFESMGIAAPEIVASLVAIGEVGAINAGLFAASILSSFDKKIKTNLENWRAKQTKSVKRKPK